MSRQGLVIDSLEFARQGETIHDRVKVVDLRRLADLLIDGSGELEFSVTGAAGEHGRHFLLVTVDGTLNLQCQRCMQGYAYPVHITNRLGQMEAGGEWPDEELQDDTFDAVPTDRHLDLLQLIEEEVLLALPIAPRHEACDAPQYREGAGKESPFAALARLKRAD